MMSTGVSPGDVMLAIDRRTTIVENGVTVPNPNSQLPVPKEITSETLTSYEIGSKNRFLDNRLQLNGTIFYYDYGAYTVLNANVAPAGQPTQFEALSSPLKSYGLELETLFQLTSNDRIGLNYSYTEAKYTDKNRPVPGTTSTFGDFFGLDRVPGLVPHRASLSYEHRFDLRGGSRLTVGGVTRWLSPHLENSGLGSVTKAQATNPAVLAAMMPWIKTKNEYVTDFNVNWTSSGGRYSVTGWVRNASDNRYKQTVNLSSVTAANYANPVTYSNVNGAPYDPRTYGLVLNVKW